MNTTKEARQVIMDMKIARVIEAFSRRYNVPVDEAADLFYSSVTGEMVEEGIADLHCRSDLYLADELWQEVQKTKESRY